MIAGRFHQGSGLGNQLHRYVMTRVLAFDRGVEFGMENPENFKGFSFMNLDMGKNTDPYYFDLWQEKKEINEFGQDVRDYDWSLEELKDDVMIDGEFQGENYYEHRLPEIREWLKVDPLYMPDDLCVINFRGGEYVGVPGLFLPKSYWDQGVDTMRGINPHMKFEVHTDDVVTAKRFFPDFPCVHNIGINWRSIRYAKYLLLSNSSFAILPALLGDAKKIVAPLYWAGYNKGFWQLKQNQYKKFTYI